MPAPEGAMERRRLGVSQQVRDLGDRERGIREVGLGRLLACVVTQGVERRAGPREAPLQRPRCRRETARHHVDAHLTGRQLSRQHAADFISHVAVGGKPSEDLGRLSLEPSAQRRIAASQREAHPGLRQGPPIPRRSDPNRASQHCRVLDDIVRLVREARVQRAQLAVGLVPEAKQRERDRELRFEPAARALHDHTNRT